MSRIYLKSRVEPLEVSDEQANKIQDIFVDDKYKRDFVIKVGSFAFSKGEIKLINIAPKEKPNTYIHEQMAKWWKENDEVRQMTSIERAKNCWGHFCLFHEGVYHKKPDESMREEVEQRVAEYFAVHTDRTIPDPMLYAAMLKLDYKLIMYAPVLRVIERIELSQQEYVREKQRMQKEQKSTDLPF